MATATPARAAVAGFVGPSNVLRSTNETIEDTINLYLESAAPGTGKTAEYLALVPGLRKFAAVEDSPIRTLFFEDGRGFGVAGATFFEFDDTGAVTVRGTVGLHNVASIVSNGTAGDQLLVCDSFNGYVYDLTANTLTLLDGSGAGSGFPVNEALWVEFMDGYGIVLQRNSRKFFISALEDFTSWDPLDVAERSEGSDNLVTVVRNHRELWFPGTKTGEVWYDSGDPLFPFAPVPGVFMEYGGAGGTASGGVQMCRFANTVAWLGQNEYGLGVINVANGYQPQRISTFAVETSIATLANPPSSYLFPYEQAGHEFLWCYFTGLPWAYVYDKTMNSWHKRALWDADHSVWLPDVARCACMAFQKILVGSPTSGIVYELRLDSYRNELAVAL